MKHIMLLRAKGKKKKKETTVQSERDEEGLETAATGAEATEAEVTGAEPTGATSGEESGGEKEGNQSPNTRKSRKSKGKRASRVHLFFCPRRNKFRRYGSVSDVVVPIHF